MGLPAVVIVGRRTAAVSAAHELGYAVVLFAFKPTTARAEKVVICSPDSSDTTLNKHVKEIRSQFEVKAVIGVTEEGVVPAARLRKLFNLSGPSETQARKWTDKLLMKQAIAKAQIPCAGFLVSSPNLSSETAAKQLGFPLVYKQRVGSGSRGMQIFYKKEELPEFLEGGKILESFVEGEEISVESFIFDGKILCVNITEYYIPLLVNIVPAEIESQLKIQIESFNERIIKALNIEAGITHCEIFITKAGLVFGEIAVRPPGGHIMELIEMAYGFNAWDWLVKAGLGEMMPIPHESSCVAGMWLLHPGAGKIASIQGVEVAHMHDVSVHLIKKEGDKVSERVGVGNEIGHIFAKGKSRKEVAEKLERAIADLIIKVE